MRKPPSKSIVTDRRPPALRAADDRIVLAQEDLADAEARRHMLIVRLVNASPPKGFENAFAAGSRFEEDNLTTEGSWPCEESPAGCCVYHVHDESDECMYCHESFEAHRKER